MTAKSLEAVTQGSGRTQHPASVFLRGLAMGAADIVPGVSGGTIAFITGIYFRLLEAISSIPGAIFKELFQGKLRAFWQTCDGTFLSALLAGILVSIVTMASAISFLLVEYPILIWSFFFGLILASVWHIGSQVRHYSAVLLVPLIVGAAAAWWITRLTATHIEPSTLVLFAAGAVAICAMILPGISGSFILVIMGMYAPVLAAIKAFDIAFLLIFMAGCLVGLLSIAKLIVWAFHKCHDLMLALLTGIMIGSLNKVWPWRETLSWRTNSAGEQVPLHEVSISPGAFSNIAGQDPQIAMAVLMVAVGIVLVLVIEWLGKRHQQGSSSVSGNAL